MPDIINKIDLLLENKQNIMDNPNFRKWFGNSKVVDKNGNPLIVYHGTKADIKNNFSLRGKYRTGGLGYFFTTDPQFAEAYATKGGEDKAKIYPVYLRIIKLFTVNEENMQLLSIGVDKILEKEKKKPYGQDRSFYPYTRASVFNGIERKHADYIEHPIITDALKLLKFDGALLSESDTLNYMVFDSKNIKSIFNNGNFSLNSKNIYE